MESSHRKLISIPRLRWKGEIDTRHPLPDIDDMGSEDLPRRSPLAAELGHAVIVTPAATVPWECAHAGHFTSYAAPFFEVQTERGNLLIHPAVFRIARVPGETRYFEARDPLAPLYQQPVLLGLRPDATYDLMPAARPVTAGRRVLGRGLDALLGSDNGLPAPFDTPSTRVVALRAVLLDRVDGLLVLAQSSGLLFAEYGELCAGEAISTPRRDGTFAIPVDSVSSVRAYRAS